MSHLPVQLLNPACSNDEIVDWLESNGVLFMARHHGAELFGRARLSRQTLLHMVTKARRDTCAAFDLSRSSIATSDQWWRDAFQAIHNSQPWQVTPGKLTKTFLVLAFDWNVAMSKACGPIATKNGLLFTGILLSMVFPLAIPFLIVGAALRKTMVTEPLTETIDEAAVVRHPDHKSEGGRLGLFL
jgi:hypothetical protein